METIFFIIILLFSVVIHEVAHGFTAYILGDPTAKLAGRLTLNPIPHIDPVGSVMVPLILSLIPGGLIFGWAKPVPFNPYNLKAGHYGPALVAIAGPVSNLLIALVFGLLIRLADVINISSTTFLTLASVVVLLNIVLAVFNLIPVPPLDGSKILFTLIPYKWRHIVNAIERYQILLIVVVIFFAFSIISPAISILFYLFTGTPWVGF